MIHISFSESTQASYCANGICSTGTPNKPLTNNTIGLYAPGMYNGPSPLALHNAQRIGIMDSKTCIMLEKNHLPNNCIPYNKLLFLDNTNPHFSGKWINDTYYHRLPPPINDAYRFYTNKVIVEVDPDPIFASKSLLITINNSNFTWTNPDDNSSGGLITITHVNRSVQNCEEATVAPIISLINDTVNYLKSGCTHTNYNDTKVTYHKAIPFSYNNPFSSLLIRAYEKTIMHGNIISNSNHTAGGFGPSNCIFKKCSFIDPYKKPGW